LVLTILGHAISLHTDTRHDT